MSKLGKNSSQSSESSAGWLISYADMMTLIACFFILMMAFANYDPVGFTKKTIEVSKHFNKDKYKHSETKMTQLQEEIASHPELIKMLKTSIIDDKLIISFSGSALFNRGQYEISEDTKFVLDALIDLIKVKDSNFRVLIEGHTDNQPIAKDGPFSSNWALSGARAASVVHRFEYFGFDPRNLVAIGLADTKPLVPNDDEKGNPIPANLKINRRVIIKVLNPINPKSKIKMGLGIYFENDNKGSAQ